mmetsp:Transcript_16798/g.22260  ORF Transcript_16798/g.22260 Transcript_16798/m.22260 type:complete len:80 (-) Transcript_16798:526-765(-)
MRPFIQDAMRDRNRSAIKGHSSNGRELQITFFTSVPRMIAAIDAVARMIFRAKRKSKANARSRPSEKMHKRGVAKNVTT